MTAEVSSLVRMLNRYCGKDDQGKSTAPITQDLLGGSSILSKIDDGDDDELDLDMQVPNGWEKRLDLKSGKVYIQRCNSPNPSSDSRNRTKQTFAKFEDLNFHPSSLLSSSSSKLPLNLFDETSLDLKLVSSSPSSSCNYQSVCTLDKVKFALERAENNFPKKRTSSVSQSLSPTNSSSSVKLGKDEQDDQEYGGNKVDSSALLYAAGCPSCLLYVMISKRNPRCPRCNSNVPLPISKKPRIDLNISM